MSTTLSLSEAVSLLNSGGALVYPTETFYALGCLARSGRGVEAVYALKRRRATMPLPVIIGDAGIVITDQTTPAERLSPEECGHLQAIVDFDRLEKNENGAWPCAVALMRLFWPGSLSILLPVSPALPKALDAGSGHIAVRLSPHDGAAALSRAAGGALVSSSANISGNAPATALDMLDPQLLREGAFGVYEALPKPAGGSPSTVLMPLGDRRVRLIREGALKREELLQHGFELE